MVARSIQETLRAVVEVPEDVNTVLDIMHNLSSNDEPAVRTELMEQVPQIAVLCHEYPEHLGGVVANNLVPMVVKYLTDPNNQVRKTSQAALLVLLEQELVSRADVHDQVCPVILDLTCPDAMDDFKTEAVALMSKMAPLIGREMTERLFLERFTLLCSDALFQVRKVCASNFGDFCSVVGTSPTEEVLVNKFVYLCEDGVWGVRKACAEVFMGVSCGCSLPTRRNKLSPVFVSLLTDQSRWVRVAAFQNLGPFISTFADPSVTGLHYNEDGVLVIGIPADQQPIDTQINADNVIIQERIHKKDDSIGGSENPETTVRDGEGGENTKEEPMEIDETVATSETELDDQAAALSAEEKRAKAYLTAVKQTDNISTLSTKTESSASATDAELPTQTNTAELPTKETHNTNDATQKTLPSYNQTNEDSSRSKEENKTTEQCPDNNCSISSNSSSSVINSRSIHSGSSGSSQSEAPVPVVIAQPSNSLTVTGTQGHLHVHLDNNPAFNSFNFWRLPLPHIELDIDIMGQTTNVCVKAKVQDNDNTYQSQVNLTMANNSLTPCLSLSTSAQEKLEKGKKKGTTVEADLEALAATLEGVTTSESSTDDMEVNQGAEPPDMTAGTDASSSSQQQATYAQVCAAAVSSVQHQNDPQPSILASRLTQARVSMTDGVVSEIKKREMDVVSPSDSSIDITSSIPSLASQQLSQHSSLLQQRLSEPFTINHPNIITPNSNENYSSTIESNPNSLTDLMMQTTQDIVPKTLLEHYISMTDPMRAETVDNEITRHCAYSLPAVALTLGRRNWPVLKDTYETLAGDMHWKVRRTLAFSIHELAVILGEELAQSDLVPVFNGFIKDLDEVRIGVLKHLAHFLRLLRPQNRRDYLHRMDEFLRTDNENNWRFRLELATQLSDMIDLFSPQDCQTFLAPIALALMGDKVVQIRRTCYTLVCQLVRQLGSEGDIQYVESLSEQLRSQFACANTWSQRQSYAFLCGQLVAEQSLALHDFSLLFLPHLLALADDRVPNVRIAVSKMLATYIGSLDHYQNPENEATKAVQCTLEKLGQDKDRDVSYFASCPVNTELLMFEQQQEPSL